MTHDPTRPRLHQHDEEVEDHDRGLAFDLQTLHRRRLDRRAAFGLLAGVGAGVALAACGASGSSSSGTSTTSTTGTGSDVGSDDSAPSDASCAAETPTETQGPYPGNGTNGPDVLTESGVVRQDIRSSFGSASGTAAGIPLTIKFIVLDSSNGCEPLEAGAVYAWHCTADGLYSMYSQGVEDENFLRGVQVADAGGAVTFASIFPGAYSGRWPHVHFQVFRSADDATGGADPVLTSQLALPEDVCAVVYETTGYGNSATNLTRTPIDQDGIFNDGYTTQMATVTGSLADGYTAVLTVVVDSTQTESGDSGMAGSPGGGPGGGMAGPPSGRG